MRSQAMTPPECVTASQWGALLSCQRSYKNVQAFRDFHLSDAFNKFVWHCLSKKYDLAYAHWLYAFINQLDKN